MYKKVICVLLLVLFSITLYLPQQTSRATTQEAVLLPDDSIPLGLAYDKKATLWVVLCWYGAIAEVNIADETYRIHYLTNDTCPNTNCKPSNLAIDGQGRVWTSVTHTSFRLANSPVPYTQGPRVLMYDPIKDKISVLEANAGGSGIIYHQNYIWVAGAETDALIKIDPYNQTVVATYPIGFREWCPEYNQYVEHRPMFIAADGDILWITVFNHPPQFLSSGFGGRLARFNITSETWSYVLTNLDRPLGVAADTKYVYVAQNTWGFDIIETYPNWTDAIVKYEKATGLVSYIDVGYVPCMVYVDSKGYLWWADSGSHYNSMGVISPFVNTSWGAGTYAYYMTEVNGEIWYTKTGSTGVYSTFVENPDLNNDYKVDIKDIAFVAVRFGAAEGNNQWNATADINRDKKIDIEDIAYVCKFFGKTATK